MKSRFLMIVAILGLVGSGVAVAQDGGLGKKGKGGNSGGSSSGGGKGNSGGGVKSDPPPRRDNGGGSGAGRGNSGGGQNSGGLGRGNSGGGNSGGSGGIGRGNSGGGNSGGSTGRGNTGNGGLGRGNSGGQVSPPIRDNRGGNGSGGSILGRPERGNPIDDTTFGKRGGNSRSGRVGYEGVHNGSSVGRTNPIVISDVPVVSTNRKIRHEGVRENRITVGDNRYRNGYFHYDRNFCDNDFWYPHYGFQWYDGCNYVTSPFYYYPHLPGYVSTIRVSIGPLSWTQCETRYTWRQPVYDRYNYQSDRYNDFDYSVGDIERSFEGRNLRYLAHLIPTRGRIEIDMGRGNEYTLEAEDFYDMLRDLVEGTRTTSYRVQNVYRDGGRATVEALHEFTDSWGRTECVRHTFGLREGRRGYEITYFRSERA